jgi:peptide/nickel transport system substrate-binding protein
LLLVGLPVCLVWGMSRLLDAIAAYAPADGGVYREAVVGASIPLDPLAPTGAPRDPDLTPLLFRGLVQVDEHGRVAPDLAERWVVSGEGRVYTFYLRPDLAWDDGVPLTAGDAVDTVRRAAQATTADGGPSFWADVAVTALEPGIVQFELREPLGSFLEHAALPIVATHAPPGDAAGYDRPASSGPYRLAGPGPGSIALERNPAYFGPPPMLDRVEFQLMPTRDAALRTLLAGQVDGLADLTQTERAQVDESQRLEVYDVPEYNKYGLLVLNTQSPVFRDRSVRQAVGQAIDRQALVHLALDGQGEPAFGPLPPLSWAFDASLPYQSSGPAAGELLETAGWRVADDRGPRRRDGQPLVVSLLASEAAPRQREASEVARQLAAVGFQVELKTLPLDRLLRDHLETGEFQAALIGRWLPETDPDQFALWHSTQARGLGGNYGGISSPELDRWLEIGRRQIAPDERGEAYRRFQAAWVEEQPSIVLYYPHTAYALSRDLQGIRGGPLPDVSWRLRELPEWHRQMSRQFAWPLWSAR